MKWNVENRCSLFQLLAVLSSLSLTGLKNHFLPLA
jgi:hypothetical protein